MTETAAGSHSGPEIDPEDCAPGSLRAQGWRQGCMLAVELPLEVITVGETDPKPVSTRDVHGLWLVAAQDCELAWTDARAPEATVELRPVLDKDPPQEWGIRSKKVRLDTNLYLDSYSPRQMVAPRVLDVSVDEDKHVTCPLLATARAAKTWLGLRYDRPAVPGRFLECFQQLASKVRARKHVSRAKLRDILVLFRDSAEGSAVYDLVGVLPAAPAGNLDDSAEQELLDWLTSVTLEVPPEVGVAAGVELRTADRVSLAFVEASYALDVTDVSWPRRGGGPIGA